jgi:hypothetical protein
MAQTTRSGRNLPEWSESNYGRAAGAPGANGRSQNKRTKNRRITRADETKRPRLVIITSDNKAPSVAPAPVVLTRHTRSQPIRCTHYGPDRHTVFPCHLFCGPCKDWESLINTGTVARNKRNSRRNECRAHHTNPAYPTVLRPGVVLVGPARRAIGEESLSSSSSDNSDNGEDEIILQESVDGGYVSEQPAEIMQQGDAEENLLQENHY